MAVKVNYDLCCWKDGKCTSSGGGGCNCKSGSGECKGCVTVCPAGAIMRDLIVKIDDDLCTDCGICVEACPHSALSF